MEPFTDPRSDIIEAIDAGGSQQAHARLRTHRALGRLAEPARDGASGRHLLMWLLLGLVRFPEAARPTTSRAATWQAAAAQRIRDHRPGLLASDAVSKLAAEHLCHYLDFPGLGRRDEEQIEWLHRIAVSLDLKRLRRNQQSRLEAALDELGYLGDEDSLPAILRARGIAAADFERFFSKALDLIQTHV